MTNRLKELDGNIVVEMPSGERMDTLNNISMAILQNSIASQELVKAINNLNPNHVTIQNVHITNSKESGISITGDRQNERQSYALTDEAEVEEFGENYYGHDNVEDSRKRFRRI